MGLLQELLGGLLKCLCTNQSEQQQEQTNNGYLPPTVPPQQKVAQQPTPTYPPTVTSQQTQPRPPAKTQPQRPTYAEQVSHQVPQTHPEEQKPAPENHKKHKKHHGHGQGQEHESISEVYPENHVAATPQPQPVSVPPVKPSSPPPRPWSPGSERPDPNQVNQHNAHYMDLRARANAAGDEMARNFDAAHQAYENRDGARAKELSNAGKAAQREMERLNDEAAEWIFRENNTDSGPGEVDLHGLYVKEAIHYTDKSIEEARARGERQLRLIVGKGIHSANHVAKIKPAIEELMDKHGFVAELDEHNSGVLLVNLDGQASGSGRVMGADDLTRGLDKKDECIIM